MIDQGAYVALCDIKNCQAHQTGEVFEGFVKLKFNTMKMAIRIRPCHEHMLILKNIGVEA